MTRTRSLKEFIPTGQVRLAGSCPRCRYQYYIHEFIVVCRRAGLTSGESVVDRAWVFWTSIAIYPILRQHAPTSTKISLPHPISFVRFDLIRFDREVTLCCDGPRMSRPLLSIHPLNPVWLQRSLSFFCSRLHKSRDAVAYICKRRQRLSCLKLACLAF